MIASPALARDLDCLARELLAIRPRASQLAARGDERRAVLLGEVLQHPDHLHHHRRPQRERPAHRPVRIVDMNPHLSGARVQNPRRVRAERHVVAKHRLGDFDDHRMLRQALEDLTVPEQPANVLLPGPLMTAAESGSVGRSGNFQRARASLSRLRRAHQIRQPDVSGPVDYLFDDRRYRWHDVTPGWQRKTKTKFELRINCPTPRAARAVHEMKCWAEIAASAPAPAACSDSAR